ncbi:MAG: alpha/beta fold hydrolase [Bacteroidales bacterium]|nr:alpha/beta fold hydrolase [Bacteroidales bacterium]
MKNHPCKTEWIQICLFVFFVLSMFFSSCEKDKEELHYDYLVSSEKLKTIKVEQARAVFNLLSSSVPDAKGIIDSAVYDIQVYKVVYKTLFKGSEIKASGIISVPDASGNFPLLSFQNGTNTLHANAPSQSLLDPVFTLLQSLSSFGYITLIADYLGFGESAEILHPYFHRESSDASVADLIHACDELFINDKIKALDDGRLFLMGYSQGAWATLSALKTMENESYFTKEIIAASCGAGAYDVFEVAKYIFQLETYPSPLYLPYFIESHIRNGLLNESLQKYFNEPYAGLIPGLFDGSNSSRDINARLTDSVALLVTAGLRKNFETGSDYQSLRNELSVNSIDAWPSNTKLMFFHGEADDDVPAFESRHIYDDFIKKGLSDSQVQLVTIDSLDHDSGLIPWGLSTITWFNELKSNRR